MVIQVDRNRDSTKVNVWTPGSNNSVVRVECKNEGFTSNYQLPR